MLVHENGFIPHHHPSQALPHPSQALPLGDADTSGALLPQAVGSYPPYERAALASAIEDGLMPDEVLQILAGRRVAEVFPVRWGESPEAYASRAVSEMFVSYLQ